MRGLGAPEPLDPFAAFVDLWEALLAEQDGPAAIVVVEGERDRRAIRSLGWDGAIVLVHRGQSLSATAQRLLAPGAKIIVLTDWDEEGGHLAHRLRDFLEAERVELDLDYRRRLARILRGELTHVEGLFGWARRQAERRGESLERLFGPTAERPTG
ncbi:MAG TPA: toprim domain-containing protein [Thermoplasmata archaeon]|nr:toprim domain-containing protein [Thermoplasmata archaeon]